VEEGKKVEEKFTPMMMQYRRYKRAYSDFILMFRLGDFYEMFGEDAHKASEILGITLTRRGVKKEQSVPMCGVPHHSASRYILRLLKAGCKVAICEQVEDPKKARGLVKREVVEVLTPGAIMREEFLDEGRKNYLCIIVEEDGRFGLSFVETSIGEFITTEIHPEGAIDRLREEILLRSPKEILFLGGLECQKALQSEGIHFHTIDGSQYPSDKEVLQRFFGVQSLKVFDLDSHPLATRASAIALSYLSSLKLVQLHHFHTIRFYHPQQRVILDSSTIKNLELLETWKGEEGSLLWSLDRVKTPMGKRFLKSEILAPLRQIPEILERQAAVEELLNNGYLRDDLSEALKGMGDLERLAGKCGARKIRPYDLFRLRNSLRKVALIYPLLQEVKTPLLKQIQKEIASFQEILPPLEQALEEEYSQEKIFRDGFDSQLDELRQLSTHGEKWFQQLEERERQRTGIKSLKVRYNKIFGYFIEVTKPNLSLVPAEYERKQTMVNAERFTTPELKQMEEKVLTAQEQLQAREAELIENLSDRAQQSARNLVKMASALALLDFLLSLSQVAEERDYCKPLIDEKRRISIHQGRHPVVEALLPPGEFVPNDAYLDTENKRLGIITGPNMSGKSTYIRQIALITLMAQMGSFVPAKKAEIGVVDGIYTRAGASDDIARGQSTFMAEMIETAKILRNVTPKSLVVLDEIGRGTSTYDGISIAWAVGEYVASHLRCRTIFATHYHELTALENHEEGVFNLQVAVEERGNDVVLLHKVVPGRATRSYGIEVARLAGLPPLVVRRAREILSQMENREQAIPQPSPPTPEERKEEKKEREIRPLRLF